MKRCRLCKTRFEPARPLQAVCSVECAKEWANTDYARRLEKAARAAETRKSRGGLETPSQAARKAQTAFNAWVRLMDRGMPCVSCGHPDDGTRQRHASHYRPVGSNPALRFEPDNVHAACSICNNHKSGNITPYRLELIRRIGIERVEWLEGPHDLPHRTVADFREIRKTYARKVRELQKEATDGQQTPASRTTADHQPVNPDNRAQADDRPVTTGA